jgi:hypothetical protein
MLLVAARLRIPEVARLLAALGGRVPGLPAARRG